MPKTATDAPPTWRDHFSTMTEARSWSRASGRCMDCRTRKVRRARKPKPGSKGGGIPRLRCRTCHNAARTAWGREASRRWYFANREREAATQRERGARVRAARPAPTCGACGLPILTYRPHHGKPPRFHPRPACTGSRAHTQLLRLRGWWIEQVEAGHTLMELVALTKGGRWSVERVRATLERYDLMAQVYVNEAAAERRRRIAA